MPFQISKISFSMSNIDKEARLFLPQSGLPLITAIATSGHFVIRIVTIEKSGFSKTMKNHKTKTKEHFFEMALVFRLVSYGCKNHLGFSHEI
ncbi:MAG: hypothetical protein KKH32_12610 [Bacteroidetes bacterium]|nr:hypothetical protein [Bacteroidota bacterium]